MTKCKCSVLKVRAESGRFCNLEPDQRLCQLCHIDIIGLGPMLIKLFT